MIKAMKDFKKGPWLRLQGTGCRPPRRGSDVQTSTRVGGRGTTERTKELGLAGAEAEVVEMTRNITTKDRRVLHESPGEEFEFYLTELRVHG